MENEEPKLVIQSHYNYVYEFLSRNGITTLILFVLGIVAANAGVFLQYLIIAIVYMVFLVGSTIYNKLKYDANTYSFYKDKVIYTDSFFHKEQKEIKYTDIKEIRYNQLFLQIPFKIGDITLSTNSGKFLDNGIHIWGVKDIQNEYQKLIKILDAKEQK